MNHLRYLWYLVKHKYFVSIECFKQGLIWRGITHDLSKLSPCEWFPYVTHFYGKGDFVRFDKAWLHHQNLNDHHWQYWVLIRDTGEKVAIEMPLGALLEMLCDWKAAGASQGLEDSWTRVAEWYALHKHEMILHKKTRCLLEGFLLVDGFK